MKKIRFYILAAISLLAVSCGGVKYLSPHFQSQTRDHKMIAVIPFKMIFKGKDPKGMTPEMKRQLEEAESRAFQQSLYNSLLNNSGAGKKDIKILIQPIDKTNRLLGDSNISIRESWDMAPEKLAKVLGVDAVIKTRVEKERYLSDLASYGIDIAQDILDVLLSKTGVGIETPDNLEKTYDITADCELFNGKDGLLLWKNAVQAETDWDYPANLVIDGVNRRFARKFPYRGK